MKELPGIATVASVRYSPVPVGLETRRTSLQDQIIRCSAR
jgi:hypothetical protein